MQDAQERRFLVTSIQVNIKCICSGQLIRYDFSSLLSTTKFTNFLTAGDTRIIAGKATQNANPQAFSQINIMSSAKPTLKTLITNDIKHDISKAIKNEKTYGVYFFGITFVSYKYLNNKAERKGSVTKQSANTY